MIKIIALLLCCVLCLSLFACGEKTPDASEPTDHTHDENGNHIEEQPSEEVQPSESVDDHSDHAHINYKGLVSKTATLADLEAAEGKAPDFSFEAGETTYYAYNKVTFGELNFDQVQASFNEGYVRISCTRTTEEGLDQIYAEWKDYMETTFGNPSQISEHEDVLKWADHTGNYVTLTQLNDTTVQLCYYLVA